MERTPEQMQVHNAFTELRQARDEGRLAYLNQWNIRAILNYVDRLELELATFKREADEKEVGIGKKKED